MVNFNKVNTFKKKATVYLIKPSKYDDEGYVIRHWKGILPSNTLACMHSLTEEACKNGALGKDIKWKIEIIDESVQKVETKKIITENNKGDTKAIVCLIGVQSNQFPRAKDLAVEFSNNGVTVLIGGFHVSGSISTSVNMPAELQSLIDKGVTIVAGEAEGRWHEVLQDAVQNQLKGVYNFLFNYPDIRHSPLPLVNKKYLKRFVSPNFTTIDCGRGCPFDCSFCTVISVHGRAMRFRDTDNIINLFRENYKKHNISFYFFTDDNFCRNKNWAKIFDSLIRLRETENIPIEFMMQVDTQSYKIPDFVSKAQRAGCEHVFIGMESLNPDNLQQAGKKHNKIEEFKELVSVYRNYEIDTHIAYIIGFPHDTPESVQRDIEKLKNEIGPEQATFFIMTPLPGSRDHSQLKLQNIEIDSDLNKYDSFHVTMPHPNMTGEELMLVYKNAYSSFYSLENMETILKRVSPKNYWDVFLKFIWYKNSITIENGHPMLEGVFRIKDRLQRRTPYPIDSKWVHTKKRIKELFHKCRLWWNLILEMEEVWLRTRSRNPLEEKVIQELHARYSYAKQWKDLKIGELKNLYNLVCKNNLNILPFVTPSSFLIWVNKHNCFFQTLVYSRKPLDSFWNEVKKQISTKKLLNLNVNKIISTTLQETFIFFTFLYSFLQWLIPHLFRNIFCSLREKALAQV